MLTLFLACVGYAGEFLILKSELKSAKAGDYIVFEQDRLITLMHIHSIDAHTITIEEVSVQEKRAPKIPWKEWIIKGAPKNNSWIMYEVDLKSGQILQSYSFSKNCWLESLPGENFLPTLLNLHFSRIPLDERKRVGKAPPQGERDRRSLWNPPMIAEGKFIPHVKFEGWRAKWPKDTSPLSQTTIEIYLPIGYPDLPSYFPYWLQLSDQFATAKLHIIDSGTGLTSPYHQLPR